MSRPRVGIVTGLRREAACFRRDVGEAMAVLRCGAGPVAAMRAATDLIAAGCRGLVSFGFAGALSPEVPAGALLVPDTVLTLSGERLRTDEEWRSRILAAAPGAFTASIVGVDAVADSPQAKAALADQTGAIAVDTESHAVGWVAAAAGLPFVVVRAISDAAGEGVPGWLLATLDTGGGVQPLAFARALFGDPRRLMVVLALYRGSRQALFRLRPLAAADSPLFHL